MGGEDAHDAADAMAALRRVVSASNRRARERFCTFVENVGMLADEHIAGCNIVSVPVARVER